MSSSSYDYKPDLRLLFNVTTSDASDTELDRILASQNGKELRGIVDSARMGQAAFGGTDNTIGTEAAKRLSDYINDLVTNGSTFDHTLDVIAAIADSGLVANRAFLLVSRVLGGASNIGIFIMFSALQQINDYVHLYVAAENQFDFHQVSQHYFDDRSIPGASAVDAQQETVGTLGVVVANVVKLAGITTDQLFTRLDSLYQGYLYTYDAQANSGVKALIDGLVALIRYYETGGPSSGHGLVIVPQSDNLVSLINDGPAPLDGVKLLGSGGAVIGDLSSTLNAGEIVRAVSVTTTWPDINDLRFTVAGIDGRISFDNAKTTFWVGQASATVGPDPMTATFHILQPVATNGIPTTTTWTFGDQMSSSVLEPTHVYACPSSYAASVTAAAGPLPPVTRTEVVTINSPYRVLWGSDNGNASVPHAPLQFSADPSIPADATVTWDFGDHTTGNGASIPHTYTKDGRYTVTIRVIQAGSTCAPQTYAADVYIGLSTSFVPLPPVIYSDLTLGPGVAGYLVDTNGLTIANGATLTLKAGVNLKLDQAAAVTVDGSLVASGVPGAPVTVTSNRDDSAGGHSSGGPTPPAISDTNGIIVPAGGTLNLTQAQIRYAGTGITASGAGATVHLDGVTINHVGGAIEDDNAGPLTVNASTISPGVDPPSGRTGNGIRITSPALPVAPTITATTISDAGYGVTLSGSTHAVLDGVSFARTGVDVAVDPMASDVVTRHTTLIDGVGFIAVNGPSFPTGFTRWTADLPYVVNPIYSSPQPMTVPLGGQLDIAAGRIVKLAMTTSLTVAGSLVASGVPGTPVIFTSNRDDTAGGHSSGVPTPPSRDDTSGLVVSAGGTVNLAQSQLRYAQTGITASGAGATVHLEGATIDQVRTAIEDDNAGPLTVNASTIIPGLDPNSGSGNAIRVANPSTPVPPTITATTISDAGYGVTLSGFTHAVLDGVSFARTGVDVAVDPAASDVVTRNTTLVDGVGFIAVNGPSFPPGLTAWTADLPYIVNPIYSSPQPMTVPAGSELDIAAGRIVKLAMATSLTVAGSLVASGAPEAPVVFTSNRDDSAGGHSSGVPTPPSRDDTAGLVVSAGGTLNLTQSQLRYAGTGVTASGAGATVHLEGSTIDHVRTAIEDDNAGPLTVNASTISPGVDPNIGFTQGISVTSQPTPVFPTITATSIANATQGVTVGGVANLTVALSTFSQLGGGIRNVGTGTVKATRDWWGNPSGPAPTGTGTPISGAVSAHPWCLDPACNSLAASKYRLAASSFQVVEGQTLTVTVYREGDLSVPTSVQVIAAPGTAAFNDDFNDPTTTVNFLAGQASTTVAIQTIGRPADGPEAFTLSLVLPTGSDEELSAPSTATITIIDPLAITSAESATFTAAASGTFVVHSTGTPTPSLSETGALPLGVGFLDNLDGTATLSGLPASGSGGGYPLVFVAHNGLGPDASQSFLLTVNEAPTLTSGASASFVAGSGGSFTITSSGFPVAALAETTALPPGIGFVDHHDGTATVNVTSTAAAGMVTIAITATNAAGTTAQALQLSITPADTIPVFTSSTPPSSGLVGTAYTYTFSATGVPTPTFAVSSGNLPPGLNLNTVTGSLSGNPSTVGTFSFTMRASNRAGSVSVTTRIVVSARLTAIAVSPATTSIPAGTTQGYTAVGSYSDGTTQDITSMVAWAIPAGSTAAISATGVALGQTAAGPTPVTATLASVSGTATLMVTPATMTSLAVTPSTAPTAMGTTQQFTAIATFTDGTTQDLTGQAAWSSDNAAVATIVTAGGTGRAGLASAVAAGTANITATTEGVAGTAAFTVTAAAPRSIAVAPASVSAAVGTTRQFRATATFSDGTTRDVTGQAAWASANTTIATVGSGGTPGGATTSGLAAALTSGEDTISATFLGVTGSATLTVTNARAMSLTLTPTKASLPKGATHAFVATATFSDATSQDVTTGAEWSSATPAVASVSAAGLVHGVKTGNATITAKWSNISARVVVAVTPAAATALVIAPLNAHVAKGLTLPYMATEILSDGTTRQVSSLAAWSTPSATIATFKGRIATAAGVGETAVTASYKGLTASVTLTATPAALRSIRVAPRNRTIARTATVHFSASGMYTDGTTQDVTASVAWASSAPAVAAISTTGKAQGSSQGTTTISATSGGVSTTVTLVVI
jgi:uncharacterized protein YjdB